jgi:hypothetical protein
VARERAKIEVIFLKFDESVRELEAAGHAVVEDSPVHQTAQHLPAAGQSRHHGPDRNLQDVGSLAVAQPFEADEKQHDLVIFRQRIERTLEIPDLEPLKLGRRTAEMIGDVLDWHGKPIPAVLGAPIHIDVMENREQIGSPVPDRGPDVLAR